MRIYETAIDGGKLDSSIIIPHLQQGHAAHSQSASQNQQDRRKHGHLGFHEEQEGNTAKEEKLEPHYKLENTIKTAGRLRPLPQYSFPASTSFQLGLHNSLELAKSQPHMIYRKLANGGGATTSTTAQVSPSIVVIIIVLTVIFFLSAFLHLLIRWLARNPALIRRGRRAGANGGAGSNNRIIALTALQGQLQQLFSIQDAGLDRSLIEELPVFSYKAAMGGLKEGADCAICLCEFMGDDQLRLLPSCGHAFHTDCIDTWLLAHSTCPLCRTLLLPECWVPGSLQPLLSSEMSTVGEPEHQQPVVDLAQPTQLGGTAGLGSSSRRSSHGHITILAGSMGPARVNQAQSQRMSNQTESSISSDSAIIHNSGVMSSSARLASFQHEKSTELSKLNACSEAEKSATQATTISSNEATSSALLHSLVSSSSTAAISDSGRLSYTSFGNNTDAQSGRYSDQLERASAYGSGRRVSVHLGKCRVANGLSKRTRKSKASGGASRRSFSKGSYEYVIDSSSNLEVLIPSHSKAPALVSSSRLNDLLNLSHRLSSSLAADAPTPAPSARNGSRDLAGRSLSPSWASASFRKLRLCNGGDTDASCMEEAINAPLNMFQPSDKPSDCNQWPADISKQADLEESSTATSMRANVGSDASFSLDFASQQFRELNVLSRYESDKNDYEHDSSKRAVSFRLPTPASHHILSAKLRASASRRALSESEALSYWEPSLTADESIRLGRENVDRMVTLDTKTGSSSFAKRTMDWLVGWPRRMVHPDRSASNSG